MVIGDGEAFLHFSVFASVLNQLLERALLPVVNMGVVNIVDGVVGLHHSCHGIHNFLVIIYPGGTWVEIASIARL